MTGSIGVFDTEPIYLAGDEGQWRVAMYYSNGSETAREAARGVGRLMYEQVGEPVLVVIDIASAHIYTMPLSELSVQQL